MNRTRGKGSLRGTRRPHGSARALALCLSLGVVCWATLLQTVEALPSGTLTVMLEAAPKTLNPVQATDAYGVRISHQLIFETLLRLGDDLEIAPGVAARWEAVTPKRYRFYLREGVTFHDGTVLTAADVVYSLESLMSPKVASPYGPGLREKLAAVRAVDVATVEIDLTAPYATILGDLVLPIRRQQKDPRASHSLNGSGPFRFVSQSPIEIVLIRHDAWRDPETGRPAGVDRIVFKVVKDENTRLLKFRKGDIDLAINAIPLDKLRQFQRPPLSRRYAVVEAPGLSYQYLGFNLDDPILQDARVRRAIALAIDVDGLIRYRQKGHSTRTTSLLSKQSTYALAEAAPLARDPETAARLLDEAGYPERDGSRFGLIYKTSTDRSAVIQARAIQDNLKDIGIVVKVQAFEWGTFYEDVQRGNFQMFSLRWVGVSDPDFYYELFHSSRLPPAGRNRVRYRDQEMDALLEQGRITADPATRRGIYQKVQQLLLRDLPYISLWHNNNIAVVSKDLEGFQLHPTGGFQHLPQITRIARGPR